MFIRKWAPLFDRDDELGSGDVDDDTQLPDGVEPDAESEEAEEQDPSAKRRGQMETKFKNASKEADKQEKKAAKETKPAGRDGRGGKALKSRARQEMESDGEEPDDTLLGE